MKESALDETLDRVSTQLGSRVREAVLVSPLRRSDWPRAAFRLRLADGRDLKLRRLRSAERAAEIAQLLDELRELGLPRVVVQQDELLVTDWIEGTRLKGEGDIRQIEQAAELLARIHTTHSHAGTSLPISAPTRDESEAVIRELEILVRARRIEAARADALTHSLRRTLPAQSQHGIVHGDFCVENLVVDVEGELRIVDNEALRVDSLDSDLARVWVRWPMSDDAWRTFVATYRKQRAETADGSSLLAWQCRQLVASASWRVERRLPGADALLERLQSAAVRLENR